MATLSEFIFSDKEVFIFCQEQIEMSGLLANEMSAFLFQLEDPIGTGDERRTFASLLDSQELSTVNLPRPLRA